MDSTPRRLRRKTSLGSAGLPLPVGTGQSSGVVEEDARETPRRRVGRKSSLESAASPAGASVDVSRVVASRSGGSRVGGANVEPGDIGSASMEAGGDVEAEAGRAGRRGGRGKGRGRGRGGRGASVAPAEAGQETLRRSTRIAARAGEKGGGRAGGGAAGDEAGVVGLASVRDVSRRSGGAGRIVSGFGAERVDDVAADLRRSEADGAQRARQRREEGTRGRMTDASGRNLDRGSGGAWHTGRQ